MVDAKSLCGADLDSLASALAYAHFADDSENRRHVPLFLSARNDLRLRPENLLALETAQVPLEALLTVDDLPADRLAGLGTHFALVDHNRLLDRFRSHPDGDDPEDDARVVAVLDHHVDERKHLAAEPRIIQLIGSCASLVTDYFRPPRSRDNGDPEPIPTAVADLLLSAIAIDTRLKPVADGGKASDVDLAAVQTLLPFSSFAPSPSLLNASDSTAPSASAPSLDGLRAFNSRLSEAKEDVSQLSGYDLLRRDYKEYHESSVRYGLSTVPQSLSTWLAKIPTPDGGAPESAVEVLLDQVRAWMDERDLALAGVLTSYSHIKKSGATGGRRRELLLLARGRTDDGSRAAFERIWAGLERDEVLRLEGWKARKEYGVEEGSTAASSSGGEGEEKGERWERWKVWQQGNAHATRKQVAPALKDLVHAAFGSE